MIRFADGMNSLKASLFGRLRTSSSASFPLRQDFAGQHDSDRSRMDAFLRNWDGESRMDGFLQEDLDQDIEQRLELVKQIRQSTGTGRLS